MADEDEINVGDYVEMSAKRLGQVRWIGKLPGKKGNMFGVEIWKGKGQNSGTLDGIQYFKCINSGMGVFVVPKAILWILDVPKNHDPFKQMALRKAAESKQKKQSKTNKAKRRTSSKPKPKASKISQTPKSNKKKSKSNKTKPSTKTNKISNNPKPNTPKSKTSTPKTKARRGSGKRPSLKYRENKLISLVEREEKLQIIQDNLAAAPSREPSSCVMSVKAFKSVPLREHITKGDNFDIAKRVCKVYDTKFNDTDTVCLVSNIGLRPLYALDIEGEYKRIEVFERKEKYVLIYRTNPHKEARTKVTKRCFTGVVKGLADEYESSKDVVNNLNILFGAGCHVVRAKDVSFDIYSRFSDGYECQIRLSDSECVLAWRR